MTHDKKTIQLPNGLAEEGDRVIHVDPEYGPKEGNIDRIEARTDGMSALVSFIDNQMPKVFISNNASDTFFLFSPTDALEAVEEERQNWHDSFYKPEVERALDGLIDRIQQKRKGR